MTGVFFTLRIAVIPFLYYKVYTIYAMYGAEGTARLGYVLVAYIAGGSIVDVMNVVWFLKIVRGARKVLKNNRAKKEDGLTVPELDCKQKQS